MELCFIEYSFLSMAKTLFASNLKQSIPPPQHNKTVLVFGGVKEFITPLQVPNKFTGYAFLLDSSNRIRWRGCGQAKPEEVETMIQCAQQLVREGGGGGGK